MSSVLVKLEMRPSMAANPGMRAWRTVKLPPAVAELVGELTEAEQNPDVDPADPEMLAMRSTVFNQIFDSVAPGSGGTDAGPAWLLVVHGAEGDRFFPLANVVQFMVRVEQEVPAAETLN
jgi:hypothetical protein